MRLNVNIAMFISAIILITSVYAAFTIKCNIIVYLILWVLALYFSHCLFHYIFGKMFGIKFKYVYFSNSMLSKASIPIISKIMSSKYMKIFMTLKLDKKGKGIGYFIMFASGALASMTFPAIISIIALKCNFGIILVAISIFNIIFTGYYSLKSGCLNKAIKALR